MVRTDKQNCKMFGMQYFSIIMISYSVLINLAKFYTSNAPLIELLYFSLSQYINAKLGEKGCDEIESLKEYIPEDIQVQHAVDAWKVACQKSEGYHLRMRP